MADITVDTLPELTTIATDDYFAVYDTSAAVLKRISRANALASVQYTNVAASVTAATTFNAAVTFGAELVITRNAATIAAGVVAAAGSGMVIDTEGAASTDDLDSITGGTTGQWLVINRAHASRTVIVKHATGNIYLNGKADYTLSGTRDMLILFCVGSEWREIGRGDCA
jgi:hypothetical protein